MSKKNFISYGDGETLFSQIAYRLAHLITGHSIKDKSGNTMTARDVLKVDGYLETTDDPTNAQTVISDAPNDITWTQYLAKSASEKQGKKWLIHDVPGICAKINAEMLSLLWENPDPTASFAAQDVILSSDNYDFLVVVFNINSVVINKGGSGNSLYTAIRSNIVYNWRRYFTNTDDTTVHFYTGNQYQPSNNSSSNNDVEIIPIAIYGLKTTLDGTMFVMAEDLGTSADKCMLSDGETSVEDRLDAHTLSGMTVIDGYTSNNRFLCPSDGYVRINARSGSTIYLYFANGTTGGVLMLGVASATEQNILPVYVKAGTYVYATDKSGNVDAVFIPLL